MATKKVVTHAPLEATLPPVSPAQVFTEAQWRVLLALADTVIPSVCAMRSNNDRSEKLLPYNEYKSLVTTLASINPGPNAAKLSAKYLEENASSTPLFKEALQRVFSQYVHEEGRKGIALILSTLNTLPGSLILTGSTILIQDQLLENRERILRGWETSRLRPLRAIYRALTTIFKKTWIAMSPTICPVIGFPRVPVHGKPADGFEYEFLQFPPGDTPEVLQQDVVIVGSGCGGAVAAKNLAEAGLRVMVVEKSYYYPTKYFPMGFHEGSVHLFESGGANLSDDGSTAVIAGSTWGGGGTINWSAALQTQAYVRKEWADSGMPFFTSHEFQKSLDRVCDRMGVQTDKTKHNHGNMVILEGARKLGYAAKAVPQNTGNSEHYCGYCTLGCASAEKKGPAESFLADAARAGALFIEGFHVDKVIVEKKDRKSVACGVEGTWTSRDAYLGTDKTNAVKRKVIIKAKKVIVSCGSLQSPLLLLRSGIKNQQIGRNLYLHPVILAAAVFKDTVRPWEGSALTTVVNEFENIDKEGHGVKIEAASMMPSIFLPVFPWRDGLDYKLWVARMPNMSSFITLTREKEPGRVYPDPVDGRCRIAYTPSVFDRKHMVEALAACAKIAYISGAQEFHTTLRNIPPFIRPEEDFDLDDGEGVNNAALKAWIAELQRKSPLDTERSFFASAHQMGTCRMGVSPKKSVVNPDCKVWGVENLFVMDASVFPSASGVNPMVTNMAIADWASKNVAKSMDRLIFNGSFLARL